MKSDSPGQAKTDKHKQDFHISLEAGDEYWKSIMEKARNNNDPLVQGKRRCGEIPRRVAIFGIIIICCSLSALVASIPSTKPLGEISPDIDSGDTAWMIVASALVLLMTPGLALFYGKFKVNIVLC